MPVTVIVGGQFGSEGKGKVAHHFARKQRASVAVRVGGSNSGHTVIDDLGRPLIFRILPTAAILPNVTCVLGAGSYIDLDVLENEIALAKLNSQRLIIDPNAYVVRETHKELEAEWALGSAIGSTQSGVGAAVVERARRSTASNLAKNESRLARYISSTRSFLRSRLDHGERLILEGTQGFGLSVLHSAEYPKATSRDTTAASFVSEAGLSPLDVDEIVLVIRTFPIRVSGDSGKLPHEIDWATVSDEGGWSVPLLEHTSVTRRVRRVARFDSDVVRQAIETNAPTTIILNHADYFDAHCEKTRNFTPQISEQVSAIEKAIGKRISYVGLGPASLLGNHYALDDAIV